MNKELKKIKNDKELMKLLNKDIKQAVYWCENTADNGTMAEGLVYINKEDMMLDFEEQVDALIKAVENY